MKRICLMVLTFVFVVSLMVIPSFAAGSFVATADDVEGDFVSFPYQVPAGKYTVTMSGVFNGSNLNLRSDAFELTSFDGSDVSLYFNGEHKYTLRAEYFGEMTTIEFMPVDPLFPTLDSVKSLRLVLDPTIGGAELFQQTIDDGIVTVLSWVSALLLAFVTPGGALNPVLSVFAVGVAISALFLGIKAVKKFIWGA